MVGVVDLFNISDCTYECIVTDGLRGAWGWRTLARNPGASFAPLSPAPATRSIKARVTKH